MIDGTDRRNRLCEGAGNRDGRRGYEYLLVNDQILVIDPRTFEIVAVLEV